MNDREGSRRLSAAIAISVALFAMRIDLGRHVGFGDAEALYACYGMHPQPAYLDHPGLVGVLFRWLASGGAPSPGVVHRFTAVVSTLVPWLGAFAARAAGAPWQRALRSFFALALMPEMAIGLFGLTPDLPLAVFWIAGLGLTAVALKSDPSSRTALVTSVFAGFACGLAVQAKASGALLALTVAVAFVSRSGRAHLRSAGPWCALVVFAILAWPLVAWETGEGYPLLKHRFVATQTASGFSLKNAGKFFGGQLLYVTPPFLLGAWFVLRDALRSDDPVDRLFVFGAIIPAVPLAVLCLWSSVAEPHWIAPAFLALGLAASRSDAVSPRLGRIAAGTGVVAVILAFIAVRTPLFVELAGASYVPKHDLTNDLHAWQVGLPLLEEEIAAARAQSRRVAVVGPHWIVCAQAHAGLGPGVPVGCRTAAGDDFRRWMPVERWKDAPTLIYVKDDRFTEDIARLFPDRDIVGVRTARIYRGGRPTRTMEVYRLDLAGTAVR